MAGGRLNRQAGLGFMPLFRFSGSPGENMMSIRNKPEIPESLELNSGSRPVKRTYTEYVRRHFDKLISKGLGDFGPCPTRMWMASIDTRTGGYPEKDARPPHIPRRHYRAIDAPRGASLYWDMPSITAAHNLSGLEKNALYSEAADKYVSDFLSLCVAHNGVFLWGNHYFWDAFSGFAVKFKGEELPVRIDFSNETGDYHEVRPIPPAWDVFWRISPSKTGKEIREFTSGSVYDENSGGFNRHANHKKGCAFLESGGILVEALAWLYSKTGDESLLALADRIAGFSFEHRNKSTGLLENNPTGGSRWDKRTCTTEVGLWAGCLLRASRNTGDVRRWAGIAESGIGAYLRYGYDKTANQYYGRLNISDGRPVIGKSGTGTDKMLEKHQPGDYADLWRPLFPAHDYPMSFAEACLDLYLLTGKDKFRLACESWIKIIKNNMPARKGKGAYAEHYGKCVHFLWRCGKVFSRESMEAALQLADEAVEILFDNGMFRGHPGEHRYDAVDGVGYLLLALIALDSGNEPEMYGSGW